MDFCASAQMKQNLVFNITVAYRTLSCDCLVLITKPLPTLMHFDLMAAWINTLIDSFKTPNLSCNQNNKIGIDNNLCISSKSAPIFVGQI